MVKLDRFVFQPGIRGDCRRKNTEAAAVCNRWNVSDWAATSGFRLLSVTSATRVLVATTPVDLRGSFNRLYGLVVEQLKGDPLSGHLIVFTNRRRNRVKVLHWDGDGLWVCAKRLEQGRVTWPVSENGQVDLRGEESSRRPQDTI
jgi:transposase